jgi:ubiquinone biosynthesis protein UbiJ
MPIVSISLKALTALINGLLAYDPASRARLARHAGQSALCVLTAPYAMHVLLDIQEEALVLRAPQGDEVDQVAVTLTGSVSDFIRLAQKTTLSRANLKQEAAHCRIEGDITLLMDLQRIASDLDIDWQDPLGSWVGDGPAHIARVFVDELKASGKATAMAAKSNAKVAIVEWQIAPDHALWGQHCESIHVFVQRLERAIARVGHLAQDVAGKKKGSQSS